MMPGWITTSPGESTVSIVIIVVQWLLLFRGHWLYSRVILVQRQLVMRLGQRFRRARSGHAFPSGSTNSTPYSDLFVVVRPGLGCRGVPGVVGHHGGNRYTFCCRDGFRDRCRVGWLRGWFQRGATIGRWLVLLSIFWQMRLRWTRFHRCLVVRQLREGCFIFRHRST